MSSPDRDLDEFSLPDDCQNSEAEGDDDENDCWMDDALYDETNDDLQPQDDPLSGTPENNIELEWCNDTSYFDNLKTFFEEKPVVNVHGKEIDIFRTLFSHDMLDHIVEETNKYAIQQQSKNWEPTTKAEIEAFIGIIILMGIHKLPSTDHYWSSDPILRVEAIAETMTVKRFKKLVENIHMNDNSTEKPKSHSQHDKLHKIRPIVDMLNSNFANTKVYHPSSYVSVDESMVKFKGRSVMKQYMPMKPVKRGYKIWCICDAKTGFVLKFRVYTGKSDSADDLSLGEKVVLELTTDVRAGSLVVFDNFFSSVPLMEKLDERKLFSCGTVRSNRKFLPDFIKGEAKAKGGKPNREKMKRGEYHFQTKGHVAATKWMDSKPVSMLSTAHNPSHITTVKRKMKDGSKVNVSCPRVVSEYNQNMGGVDRVDQLRERYEVGRRSRKWWHRLMYFLFDVTIVNSFVLWSTKTEDKKKDQLGFRLRLARQLVNGFNSRKRSGRPANFINKKKRVPDEVRLTQIGIHLPKNMPTPRRCKRCSTRKHDKRTRVMCTHCKIPLCINCFAEFHKSA